MHDHGSLAAFIFGVLPSRCNLTHNIYAANFVKPGGNATCTSQGQSVGEVGEDNIAKVRHLQPDKHTYKCRFRHDLIAEICFMHLLTCRRYLTICICHVLAVIC
jgi:hypothetical protein